jgi:hypothetical protein
VSIVSIALSKALDAIEQALEQALTAPAEIQQRWQLNQLCGLLLTLPLL